jgi:hypothetical protein
MIFNGSYKYKLLSLHSPLNLAYGQVPNPYFAQSHSIIPVLGFFKDQVVVYLFSCGACLRHTLFFFD